MNNYILLVLWALDVIYNFIASNLPEQQYDAEAAKRGCQRAPRKINRLPFGLDFFMDAREADAAHQVPEMMIRRFGSMGPGVKTFEHYTLGSHGLSTIDPRNLQAIMATQAGDFGLGARRNGIFRPLLGEGVFAVDGLRWEHARAMLQPQFSRAQISELGDDEEHVRNMMRALAVGKDGWTSKVDLHTLFVRLTLDSLCEFLFGESVNSQLVNLPEALRQDQKIKPTLNEVVFAESFDAAMAWCSDRTRLMGKYWLVDGPGRRRSVAIVHQFVDYFVRRVLDKQKRQSLGEKKAGEEDGPIQKYVFLEALANDTQNPEELRSQICNLLVAGRDTTAALLSWTVFLLARHPDVFRRLRRVIIADFGSYTQGTHDTSISFATLKSCNYLQWVLNETLRLHSIIPINMRQALRDTTLPHGGGPDGESPVFVRQGQVVDFSTHVLHHTKEYWGEDADVFKPERWSGRRFGWEYLPFHGGPRTCLGQQYSLMKSSFVLVRLLQRFDDIENLDLDTKITHNLTLTSSPFKGVQVKLHESEDLYER